MHATTLGLWKCNAPQLFATICSTVHKRLWSQCRKFKYRNKFKNAVGFLAHYYTLTNDDTFFRRCLAMIQKERYKDLRNFCYWKKCNLDDNTRFLYDQTVHSVLWFQSRVERAPRRELSIRRSDDVLAVPALDGDSRKRHSFRHVFDATFERWASIFTSPRLRRFVDEIDPHRCVKGFSYFRG